MGYPLDAQSPNFIKNLWFFDVFPLCFFVFCGSSWSHILAVIDPFADSGWLTAARHYFVLVVFGSGGPKVVAGGLWCF